MSMKRNEIIEIVKSMCSVREGFSEVVFDDSYEVKGGRNRRLKFSGVYDKEDELERLKKRLVGEMMICNEGRWSESRWRIIDVYRRLDSDSMNYWWRNDSGCVCVKMKKINKIRVWEE